MEAWHLLWDFRCVPFLLAKPHASTSSDERCDGDVPNAQMHQGSRQNASREVAPRQQVPRDWQRRVFPRHLQLPRTNLTRLSAGKAILNAFDSHDLSSIEKCRKLAEEVFGKKWQELEDGVYKQGEDSKVDSWGIGNCHIDTAWLVRSFRLTSPSREKHCSLSITSCLCSGLLPKLAKRLHGTRQAPLMFRAISLCGRLTSKPHTQFVVDAARPHGALPRAPIRRFSGSAVRLARERLPAPVQQDPRQSSRRKLHSDR